MDAIFTIPYSEYAVIDQINQKVKKKGISVYVPASRQEKGADFLLVNNKTRKTKLFQVKASRSYATRSPKKIDENVLDHHLWINNVFQVKTEKGINKLKEKKGLSDWYILFGLCPISNKKSTRKKASWLPLTLCFKEKELLKLAQNKKNNAIYIRFSIQNNEFTEIRGDRALKKVSLKKYLLENKILEIIADLK